MSTQMTKRRIEIWKHVLDIDESRLRTRWGNLGWSSAEVERALSVADRRDALEWPQERLCIFQGINRQEQPLNRIVSRVQDRIERSFQSELAESFSSESVFGAGAPGSEFLEFVMSQRRDSLNRALWDLERRKGEISAKAGFDVALDQIVDVKPVGDRHPIGRAVLLFQFQHGTLIYKPRDLGVDQTIWRFVDLLAEEANVAPLRRPWIVRGQGASWSEFLRAERPDPVVYPFGFGFISMALALVGVADLHTDNCVISETGPTPIDLEVCFQPELVVRDVGGLTDSQRVARRILGSSPIATGMYPSRVRLWDGELIERKGQRIDDVFATGSSLADAAALDALAEGVRSAGFAALRARSSRVLEDWLNESKSVSTRVLLRDTSVYAGVLKTITKEPWVWSAIDRAILLESLSSHLGESDPAHEFAIVEAEQAALVAGDIPEFTSSPTSVVLRAGGNSKIVGAIQSSGLASTRRRLLALSTSEVAKFSRWAAVSMQAVDVTSQSTPRPVDKPAPDIVLSDNDCLDAARSIADVIIQNSITGQDGSRSWIGLEFRADTESYRFGILDPISVYSGTAGIGIALASLAAATGLSSYEYAALATVLPIRELRVQQLSHLPLGLYSGLGSVMFTMASMAHLLEDESALAGCRRFATELARSEIPNDPNHDVVSGLAGLLLAVLAMDVVLDFQIPDSLLRDLGLTLVDNAQREGENLFWSPIVFGSPLCGFAHGNGGIASALYRCGLRLNSELFVDAALSGFAFEENCRSLSTDQKWPDLRPGTAKGQQVNASWCHGAAGLANARLPVMTTQDRLRPEASDAWQLMRSSSDLLPDDSLCHGQLGVAETERVTARETSNAQLAAASRRRVSAAIAGGPTFGQLGSVNDNPGLMTGYAGGVYALAQQASKHRPNNIDLLSGSLVSSGTRPMR